MMKNKKISKIKKKIKNFETPYGYFSEDGKEYIIKTPQTPRPWLNIISNMKNYSLAVSQAGSGYSWYLDARRNRITSWNQDLIRDNCGKFIYIRDNKTAKFWSCTYQPVKKTSKRYLCRHGLGYTIFENLYNDILSTLTVFIPTDDSLEIWSLTLENQASRKRDLSLFTYLEWALPLTKDRKFHNLFIKTAYEKKKKALFAAKGLEIKGGKGKEPHDKRLDYIAFHASSIKPTSWDSDKEQFLGTYRDLNKPLALTKGNCSNSVGRWNDAIASLNVSVKLKPKEKKKMVFLLGLAQNKKRADALIKKYNSVSYADETLNKTKKMWLDMLNKFHIETPDKAFNFINNYWLKYQTISSRFWGKSTCCQLQGDYNVKDQLQDSQIFLTIDSKLTKKQILLNASHQFKDGTIEDCDNFLWLPFIVVNYLKETADYALLKRKVSYLDCNRKTSIYDHCLKSINKALDRLNPRGLPVIGEGNWNDDLYEGTNGLRGESIWLAHFLYGVLSEWSILLLKLSKKKIAKRLKDEAQILKDNINKYAWDGKWYIRLVNDGSVLLGSKNHEEGKIFLNAQTWALINKVAPRSRLKSILNSLDKYLYRDFGPLLFYPAYTKEESRIEYLSCYEPGTKRNGALDTRAASWAVIAEVIAGRPQRAWDLYNRFLPVHRGMDPDFYKVEPYVTCQSVDGPASKKFGQGECGWYTDSACWSFKAAVEWLLGIRAEFDGLRIQPILPDEWTECYIKRIFRGCLYKISMIKYDGPDQIIVDGKVHKGNIIAAFSDKKEHNIIFRITKNCPLKSRKIS